MSIANTVPIMLYSQLHALMQFLNSYDQMNAMVIFVCKHCSTFKIKHYGYREVQVIMTAT